MQYAIRITRIKNLLSNFKRLELTEMAISSDLRKKETVNSNPKETHCNLLRLFRRGVVDGDSAPQDSFLAGILTDGDVLAKVSSAKGDKPVSRSILDERTGYEIPHNRFRLRTMRLYLTPSSSSLPYGRPVTGRMPDQACLPLDYLRRIQQNTIDSPYLRY